MRRFGWRIAAFESNTGGCQAPDSSSDPWLLNPATDPAFAARYIIARRTTLPRALFYLILIKYLKLSFSKTFTLWSASITLK